MRVARAALLAALLAAPANAGFAKPVPTDMLTKPPKAKRLPAGALVVERVEGGKLTRNGKPAAAGAVLAPGDVVALSGGRAFLRAGDAGHLLLKNKARLVVEKERPGVFLQLGGLLSALPRLDKKLGFRVRTSAAVAAVRGTDFYVETRGPKSAYVCACSGWVEISAPGEKRPRGEPLASENHTARVFRLGDAGLMESGAGLEGHSDDERVELHALDPKPR